MQRDEFRSLRWLHASKPSTELTRTIQDYANSSRRSNVTQISEEHRFTQKARQANLGEHTSHTPPSSTEDVESKIKDLATRLSEC